MCIRDSIGIGKDGRKVYVSIREGQGAVDVVDTVTLQKVKSIPIKGAVHNTYVTPDGKYVVAGSISQRIKNFNASNCRISRPARRQCSKVATSLMEWRLHRTERFLSWTAA